jgi:hypothetical protein
MRVENIRNYRPSKDEIPVFIGRNYEYWSKQVDYKMVDGSVLSNPFGIGIHGNRDEVIELFRSLFLKNPEMQKFVYKLKEMEDETGKEVVLVCFCKPKKCHGDVIVEWVNNVD